MRKRLFPGILAGVLLSLTACAAPSADIGVIAMVPFASDDFGIRGVAPAGWAEPEAGRFDCGGPPLGDAQLLQKSFPGSVDELAPALMTEIGVDELPRRAGIFKGSSFTWDLYAFELQIEDSGTETYRARLAMAEGESASYFVAVAAMLDAYDANAPLLGAVFTHALYALAPLD